MGRLTRGTRQGEAWTSDLAAIPWLIVLPCADRNWPPSSSGLGRLPFTQVTRVRIPLGVRIASVALATSANPPLERLDSGSGQLFEDVGKHLIDDLGLRVGIVFVDQAILFANVEAGTQHQTTLVDRVHPVVGGFDTE